MGKFIEYKNIFSSSTYLYKIFPIPFPLSYPRRPMTLIDGLKCGIKDFYNCLRSSTSYLEDEYLWVVDDWSANYYHWMFDIIPKLMLGKNEANCSKVLLPFGMKRLKYVEETLIIINIEPIYLEPAKLYKIKNCKCIKWLGYDNSEQIKFIKNKIINYYNIKLEKKKKWIYISRSDASFRKINNEISLIKKLKALGFDIIVLSEISWRNQIEIFAQAELVIGMHGAGLSNIIFSSSNTTLIEIRPDISTNICFKHWSDFNDCNHLLYSIKSNKNLNMQKDNFNIDINDFLRYLVNFNFIKINNFN
jgi:capsular polysaccharide biosynthesis protein